MAATRSDWDSELLERISVVTGDGIDPPELQRRLGISNRHLAERLLAQLDQDGDGVVSEEELVRGVEALVDGTPEQKLRFVFGVHDEDGNGYLEPRELYRILRISLCENRLAFGDDIVEELAEALFEKADTDGDRLISFEEFRAALEHYPGVLDRMTVGDVRPLGFGEPESGVPSSVSRARALLARLATEGTWMALLALYVAANAALFVEAFLRYRADGADLALQIARGCGACLNLHGALVLVPMCRKSLTWLERTRAGRVMVDDHVAFHRLVGNAAFWLGVVHGAAHVVRLASGLADWLATAVLTGFAILAVHFLMWAMAQDPVRRSGRFELFHWTHRLYPLWVGLLLMHGPVAWKWMALPLIMFAIESLRAPREPRRLGAPRRAPRGRHPRHRHAARGLRLRRGRLRLRARPRHRARRVAPLPRSAARPERDDALTLHSAQRRQLDARAALSGGVVERADRDLPRRSPRHARAPHIGQHRHVILVAAGIGVTPFASVLEEPPRPRGGRRGARRRELSLHLGRQGAGRVQLVHGPPRARRAERPRALRRPHLHGTRGAATSRAPCCASRWITSTRAPTRISSRASARARPSGAPDWDELLASIMGKHAPDRVDCFYCGPSGLATIVKKACARHGIVFRQEHF